MSSFRKRGKNAGKKGNFYAQRAKRVAKQLGHDQPSDNKNQIGGTGKKKWNKRNPNNHAGGKGTKNADDFDFTSAESRKTRLKEKLAIKAQIDDEDEKFGFERYKTGAPRLGWLLNMVQTIIPHSENGEEQSGLDLYWIEEDGGMFKSTVIKYPYFFIHCEEVYCHSMEQFLRQKFDGLIHDVQVVKKVDLAQKNHLSGIKKSFLKLTFLNDNDLKSAAQDIRKKIEVNKQAKLTKSVYGESFHSTTVGGQKVDELSLHKVDLMGEIIDIREFDVPFITRCCIDLNMRVANWYDVTPLSELNGCCELTWRQDIKHRPEVKIFAYDIETEKAPLKFPNAEHDRIMMISYMIDTEGYLITNREIVAKDIDDFEYTPKPEYEGRFTIFNEENEEQLLRRFFEHIREERPHVYVHYNGDFFDWPFIEKRAFIHGLNMREEIGVSKDGRTEVYVGRFVVNIDCYSWVSRDSYLPQGSQGLKAVVRKKLKYNPVELDPELMLPYAQSHPEELATYSVSDAVATYYLFKKYVQDFIFSLCQIIPLNSGDVLRKGTGTLCEALLMVQAYERDIIAPNKVVDKALKFHEGHLLDSETYIGGTVEAFEAGVFRSDFEYKFKVEVDTIKELITEVPATVKFFIEVEKKKQLEDVTNFDEIVDIITKQLTKLTENDGYYIGNPLIYHLDVAAMYPNIILTNRLQPVAVVDEEICASCDFNRPGKQCQRSLPWRWRGKYYPGTKGEYNQIRAQIEYETFDADVIEDLRWFQKRKLEDNPSYKFQFSELNQDQQNQLLKKRVKDYSQKVYRKATITKEEDKQSVICQRENGFYVETVRNFRDRRYVYKGLAYEWARKLKAATNEIDRVEAGNMATMYDSVQLAHKCILNSFYGYVMRRGSRWYSMDMAAITTHIGGNIIMMANELCHAIGRPIEMDTDGIWTMLPGIFPAEFELKLADSTKTLRLEYPGSMLNLRTHREFTNDQHQELIDTKNTGGRRLQYKVSSECSIFFEVDGPYKCMMLPASEKEGKMLKKRYAVFNHDGSLAELKGFEIKRRGELQIIKVFQEQVFKTFLKGSNLHEVYQHVAMVGKRWLDLIDTKAAEISDDDLFEYITQQKNMSKEMHEYGGQKSVAITCAKRLASFLGESILTGGKLCCKFLISRNPIDDPVSQRAIPVEIFKTERSVMKQFLRKWTKDQTMSDFDIRSIVDWEYYRKRVGTNIQKIITIPAAMQKLPNPIPSLQHPSWLHKKIAAMNDPFQQKKITSFFTKGADKPKQPQQQPQSTSGNHNRSMMGTAMMDIEDFAAQPLSLMASQKRRHEQSSMMLDDSAMLNDSAMLQDSELQDSPQKGSQKENRMSASNIGAAPPPEQAVVVSETFEGDVSLWLTQSKALWAQQAETRRRNRTQKRKRGRDAAGMDDVAGGQGENKRRRVGDSGADGYFRQQQRLDELYSNAWQIVQVVPLDTPGRFALWIYVNGRLRRVKLIVRRPFYINVSKLESFPNLQQKGKLVSRVLPRFRPQLNLLQLQLKEDDFREQSKQISVFLTHPDVEGVYETNVPLIFRVVSCLGCCAAVQRGTKHKNSHSTLGFQMSELEFRSTAQSSYLKGDKFAVLRRSDDVDARLSRECIKYMYLYHSTASTAGNNDARSLFGFIYQMKRERLNEYHVRLIAVNPARGKNKKLPAVPLQQYARQMIEHFQLDHHADVILHVKESQVSKVSKGFTECNAFVEEYKLMLNGPTIVMLQSKMSRREMCGKVAALRENYPVIPLLFNVRDNQFPALQWYPVATRKMLESWLVVPALLEQKKGFARYSHIPVGNMPDDVWGYTSDVFFSRLLADNKHLWWISQGCRPDLGGLEEDENLFDDEHFNPVMNHSGAYHTFCIELEINHLATNTVLQSEHIQTLEMGLGGDAGAGDMALTDRKMQDAMKAEYVKSNIRMDDTSACMASFKILKKMVQNWCRDVGAHSKKGGGGGGSAHTQYADRLLMEFYRWLRTPASLFYDPLLHRMVHRLMKKVLMQLVAQFRRFGATVIYASFDRIILETGKNEVGSVVAYMDSCLGSIAKQDLFEWLIINPTNFWECLVWHDHANFGGYLLREKENGGAKSEEDRFEDDNFERELEVRWNIASFLPTFAEDSFDVIFAGYLTDVRNEYRRLLGIDDGNTDQLDSLFTQKRQQALQRQKDEKEEQGVKRKLTRRGNDKAEMDESDDDAIDLGDDLGDDEDFFGTREKEAQAAHPQNREDDDVEMDGDADTHPDLMACELKEKFAQYKQELIEQRISGKIFQYVKQIKAKLPKDTSRSTTAAEVFPVRPGSYLPLQDPALEFIKYVVLVLSLDTDVTEQATNLRKNLLRMVDVGSFDQAAKFVDPCMTYILPDVNCFKCKQSKDLDLCRDPFTQPLSLQAAEEERADADDRDWNVKCHGCGALYDKDLVESLLLDVVRRRETAYHVQDVVCADCGKSKMDDMTEYCRCSGRFRNKESKLDFEKSMDVFSNIAQFYQFEFLLDTLDWITHQKNMHHEKTDYLSAAS